MKLLMNKRVRQTLILVFAAALVFCLVKVIRQQREYAAGEEIYAEAMEAAGIGQNTEQPSATEPPATEGTPAPELPDVDVSALQALNADVVGWILIPDTIVSYPVLQGWENSYYLGHTWNHVQNSSGSIFLDYMVSRDFSDFSTIIYGHRMNNGTMFASLREYNSLDYWKEHPSVYIIMADDTVYRYDIYAAYEAPITEITYERPINDEEKRDRFIEYGLESSVIDTGIVPTRDDRTITLVTCTGNGYSSRWVVQAVLGVGEETETREETVPETTA